MRSPKKYRAPKDDVDMLKNPCGPKFNIPTSQTYLGILQRSWASLSLYRGVEECFPTQSEVDHGTCKLSKKHYVICAKPWCCRVAAVIFRGFTPLYILQSQKWTPDPKFSESLTGRGVEHQTATAQQRHLGEGLDFFVVDRLLVKNRWRFRSAKIAGDFDQLKSQLSALLHFYQDFRDAVLRFLPLLRSSQLEIWRKSLGRITRGPSDQGDHTSKSYNHPFQERRIWHGYLIPPKTTILLGTYNSPLGEPIWRKNICKRFKSLLAWGETQTCQCKSLYAYVKRIHHVTLYSVGLLTTPGNLIFLGFLKK